MKRQETSDPKPPDPDGLTAGDRGMPFRDGIRDLNVLRQHAAAHSKNGTTRRGGGSPADHDEAFGG
jgi:hypothetical protein